MTGESRGRMDPGAKPAQATPSASAAAREDADPPDAAAASSLAAAVEAGLAAERAQCRGAAVLIALVPGEGGYDVLFEVRARKLATQPGEVCFPGGHIEEGETPRDAAVRETCEELLVAPCQVEVVADLGCADGPGGMPAWVFVGVVRGFSGTFSPAEVDRVFTVPLAWFRSHRPRVWRARLVTVPPDDFPWDLVPDGRGYRWRPRWHDVPFYLETDPLIWGFTARMLSRFVDLTDGWEASCRSRTN